MTSHTFISYIARNSAAYPLSELLALYRLAERGHHGCVPSISRVGIHDHMHSVDIDPRGDHVRQLFPSASENFRNQDCGRGSGSGKPETMTATMPCAAHLPNFSRQ